MIEATQFIASCYGITQFYESMSDLRFKIWKSKPGLSSSKSFKLPSLSPTSEAVELHVRRAHHQAIIWRAVLAPDPPVLNYTEYGWRGDHPTKTVLPIDLHVGSRVSHSYGAFITIFYVIHIYNLLKLIQITDDADHQR